jgi:single-strand DNA-binding protein
MNLNCVILIGRLTKDPELKYTPNGIATSTFSLAINRDYTTQDGKKEVDYLNIVVWRQTAENCKKYLRKGSLVAVEGRIQTRSYDNNEGKKVYVTEILGENVRFLDSKKSSEESEPSSPASYGSPPPERSSSAHSQDPFQSSGKKVNISDNDIPFFP